MKKKLSKKECKPQRIFKKNKLMDKPSPATSNRKTRFSNPTSKTENKSRTPSTTIDLSKTTNLKRLWTPDTTFLIPINNDNFHPIKAQSNPGLRTPINPWIHKMEAKRPNNNLLKCFQERRTLNPKTVNKILNSKICSNEETISMLISIKTTKIRFSESRWVIFWMIQTKFR